MSCSPVLLILSIGGGGGGGLYQCAKFGDDRVSFNVISNVSDV